MRRTFLAASCLALALLASERVARAEITWRQGALDPVLGEARGAQRFVVLDFAAEWCGPCQTMDSVVWSRADIGNTVAQNYVALRVDADSDVGSSLMRRFNVGALPTILALRADGTEIDRLTGDNDATTVLAALGAWRRGESTLSVLATRVQQRPNDLAMRLDVGTRFADRGDAAHATEHLRAVIAGDPRNEQGYKARALLALGDRLYLHAMHDAAQAVAPLEELVRSYPNSESATQAYVPLATAFHRTHHDDEARRAIDTFLAGAGPSTIGTRSNAVAWMMFRERWELPRAEQIARTGFARAPRDHALADTLAEIVFAQGRATDAVQIEQQAASLDPGNRYYPQQIARFRAAASSAPPASTASSNPSAAPAGTGHSPRPTRRSSRTPATRTATSHASTTHAAASPGTHP
jgi:thioredoxin-like negative regulator of GroEL